MQLIYARYPIVKEDIDSTRANGVLYRESMVMNLIINYLPGVSILLSKGNTITHFVLENIHEKKTKYLVRIYGHWKANLHQVAEANYYSLYFLY